MVQNTRRLIPFVDLVRQYRRLEPQILRAIRRVLGSGNYILGPEVAAFEQEFARYCGRRYGVGLASGTDALELAVRALGIGPGDEVITTPLTFIATVEAIIEVGAKPVFADVDPVSYTLDPQAVARKITKRTKAVIPVHLYGQAADMAALLAIARAHRLRVVEDCAQAVGATCEGRQVGSLGDIGCFSFYPSKNLGAYGDGGMVVTNQARLAERIRILRTHGAKDKYHHIMHGTNSRLHELHAAMLRIKLRHIHAWNAGRRRVARWYTDAFRRAGVSERVIPQEIPGRRHVYHLYVVRTRQRAILRDHCARHGVVTGIHYPLPLHLQPALRWMGHRPGSFPHSERAARETFSLPLFPEMTHAEAQRVIRVVQPRLLQE